MICDSTSSVMNFFATAITVIAFVFAILTIRANTTAMKKSNVIKEQENSLKYI